MKNIGSTRCEGCDMLFCLQCMNKHHAELIKQFQQLMHIRNELKESFDTAETMSLNENKHHCFIEVDRWECKTIERIREIARDVRTNIHEIMAKNMTKIRYQLEELSTNMQQKEKEENYLENDIERIQLQLNQLKETIEHVNEEIQVITSDRVAWDALIHVKIDGNSREDCPNLSKLFLEDRVPVNQETLSNTEPESTQPISSLIVPSDNSSDSERNSSMSGASGNSAVTTDSHTQQIQKDEDSLSRRYFLERIQQGEDCLSRGDLDNGVDHLVKSVAVCSEPQSLMSLFQQTLPPELFQEIIMRLRRDAQSVLGLSSSMFGGSGITEPDSEID